MWLAVRGNRGGAARRGSAVSFRCEYRAILSGGWRLLRTFGGGGEYSISFSRRHGWIGWLVPRMRVASRTLDRDRKHSTPWFCYPRGSARDCLGTELTAENARQRQNTLYSRVCRLGVWRMLGNLLPRTLGRIRSTLWCAKLDEEIGTARQEVSSDGFWDFSENSVPYIPINWSIKTFWLTELEFPPHPSLTNQDSDRKEYKIDTSQRELRIRAPALKMQIANVCETSA